MSRATMAIIGAIAVGVVIAGIVAAILSQTDRSLARREVAWNLRIQPGDVVLQDLACGMRCDLVRDLTVSRYTQAGVVLEESGKREVWEAFAKVGPVPLEDWIDRGKQGRVAVYRPSRPVNLVALADALHARAGKPFDPTFQWSDASDYPAELVVRAYSDAGIQLVAPHGLDPALIAQHAKGVRGLTEGKLTENTLVVMPVDLARSPKLTRMVDELEGAP